MIYFISDLHGGQDTDGLIKYIQSCNNDDLLIILGDLELHFRDTDKNREFTEFFESLPCNIAFIDGNHENFHHLLSLPEENWCGGKIHRLTDNIVHLCRGEIYEIEGNSFFTMGGCKSSQKWKDQGLWWPEENPSEDEIKKAYETLKKHGDKVDFILTHYYKPEETAENENSLQGLLKYIDKKVEFKHWYAGHWHKEEDLDSKHTIVFKNIVPLKK